ncbi:SMI1/KNR4 family protein [Flagellimonas sp. 2504JD4-2]
MTNAQKTILKLNFLRESDTSFIVFGSDHHNYQINPTLKESEIGDFEAKEGVKLPQGYRTYLQNIANGGAGPNYGIYPLQEARNGAGWLPAITELNNRTREEEEHPGELLISHNGCGLFTWLKVTGPASGEIWIDGRVNGQTPYCIGNDFLAWYESWLDRTYFEKGFIAQLAAKALRLGQQKSFKESFKFFELIVETEPKLQYNIRPQVRKLYLTAFCNVLYFLLKDNTGLPIDATLNKYFLDKCIPYAEENPAIYFNAACVYAEMKEYTMVRKCIKAAKEHNEIYPLMIEAIKKETLFADFRTKHTQWT